MPKQKTHKGLSKRVKITATGKLKHKRSFTGHLMTGKSAKRRRRLSSPAIMNAVMTKKARMKLNA